MEALEELIEKEKQSEKESDQNRHEKAEKGEI